MEINDKLTTEGRWEGIMGGKKNSYQGTYIKDTWTKLKWVGSRVGGGDRWYGGSGEGKMETTVLEQ